MKYKRVRGIISVSADPRGKPSSAAGKPRSTQQPKGRKTERVTDRTIFLSRSALAEELPEYEQHYYIEPAKRRAPFAYRFFKRAADIVLSAIGIIVCFIPTLIICAVVAIDSPGAPIFTQTRLGRGGKPFRILKIRTMRLDAEDDGPRWAMDNDERCTRTGNRLRRYHLDELPQLWNILKGDMSFVGPRPERPCFYEEFERYIHGFENRLAVRPGLTGLAQVSGGYDLPPEEKIVYDMEYINNCTPAMDIKCIVKTVGAVFRGDGK